LASSGHHQESLSPPDGKKIQFIYGLCKFIMVYVYSKTEKKRMEDLSCISLAIDGYKMLQPTMP
jgi:hypothetical protein